MKTQQEQKDRSEGSNVFYLETRSSTEEEYKTEQRTLHADNHFPVENTQTPSKQQKAGVGFGKTLTTSPKVFLSKITSFPSPSFSSLEPRLLYPEEVLYGV